MKTILNGGVLVALLVAASPEVPNSALQAQPARAAQAQAATASTPAGDPSGDSFYYFTLGHMQEQEFEASGDSDQATQCIDSYKKALALEPDSTVIQERLAEIYAKSQHIRE